MGISIQGLILGTAEPFYNEPGFETYQGKPNYVSDSLKYNKELRRQTLRWAMIDPLRKILFQEERKEKIRLHKKALKKQTTLQQQHKEMKKQQQQLLRAEQQAAGMSSSQIKSKQLLSAASSWLSSSSSLTSSGGSSGMGSGAGGDGKPK